MGDTQRIAKATVLGAVGGGSMATTMIVGSATAGAKAGAIAGMMAGPVGVVVGVSLGAAFGFSSYWVAKGISSLYGDGDNRSAQVTLVAQPTPTRTREGNGRQSDGGDADRDPDRERDQDDNEDDRDEESSASENEDESEADEESTEVSDCERLIMQTLERIARCPSNAPASVRSGLLRELSEAVSSALNDAGNPVRVRIDPVDGHLVIPMEGYRPIHLPTNIRDNLSLFDMVDIQQHLGPVDVHNQAVIYNLRCRECGSNYVGKTRDFDGRIANHRSLVNSQRNSSVSKHLQDHAANGDDPKEFDDGYDVYILKGLPEDAPQRLLRNWEVFFQWLMKGKKKDGGIGWR